MWFESSEPLYAALPDSFDEKLRFAQRLLLIRVLRPDALLSALQDWVKRSLGPEFLQPKPLRLVQCLADSRPHVPILLLLAPGADPLEAIYRLASRGGNDTPVEGASRVSDEASKAEGASSTSGAGLTQAKAQVQERDVSSILKTGQLDEGQSRVSAAASAAPAPGDKKVTLKTVSLGQGQGALAERSIIEARERGFWVVLQNCHLGGAWLKELDRICAEHVQMFERPVPGARPLHANFRLWLTSYPSPAFPVSVLQEAVKGATDTPQALRASLLRAYHAVPVAEPTPSSQLRRLLFSLSFLHAVLKERLKYGTFGWNVSYQFAESDLEICARKLRQYTEAASNTGTKTSSTEPDSIPFEGLLLRLWSLVPVIVIAYHPLETCADVSDVDDVHVLAALWWVASECVYGGRVSDDEDRRLLASLTRRWLAPASLEPGDLELCTDALGTTAYTLPAGVDSHEQYLTWIAQLPAVTPPEVSSRCSSHLTSPLISILFPRTRGFHIRTVLRLLLRFCFAQVVGLHANADARKAKRSLRSLLDSLLLTLPREARH